MIYKGLQKLEMIMPKSVACEAACFLVIGKPAVINNSDAPVNTGGDLPVAALPSPWRAGALPSWILGISAD